MWSSASPPLLPFQWRNRDEKPDSTGANTGPRDVPARSGWKGRTRDENLHRPHAIVAAATGDRSRSKVPGPRATSRRARGWKGEARDDNCNVLLPSWLLRPGTGRGPSRNAPPSGNPFRVLRLLATRRSYLPWPAEAASRRRLFKFRKPICPALSERNRATDRKTKNKTAVNKPTKGKT